MAFKRSCCVVFLLVLLQVFLEPATASITQAEVESCISFVKNHLQKQQGTAKKNFEELRTRNLNNMEKMIEERREDLLASVKNEKNVLTKLKQSAIQDDFNVTMCKDSSAIFVLILISYDSSTAETLFEYKNNVNRNHTQNSMLVDKLALKYQELEKDLSNCHQQSQNSDCLDEVQDKCGILRNKNEIFDFEYSYYRSVEKNFDVFKSKISSLYEQKLEEAKSFSSKIRSCYTSVKKHK